MRRLFLPLVVAAVTIGAIVLTIQANDDANPDDPSGVRAGESVATPLFSVRRAPDWLRRPTADGRLEARALTLLERPDMPEAACLRIDRDEVPIVENGRGLGLVPGRTQRLVTIGGLDLLAADAGFNTKVVRSSDAEIVDGALEGDLWLIGGGDPALSTNDYISRFADDRAFTGLEQLAAEVAQGLAQAGITSVRGRVVGDESLYAEERDYEADGTWSSTDNDDNEVGPLSALLVNNGFLPPFPDPPDPASNRRSANPAADAAGALQALLEFGGVSFSSPATDGDQPPAAQQVELGTIASPPLAALARRALVDGTTAEMLFRAIGLRSGAGTTRAESAFLLVFQVLEPAGMPVEATFPADGSGLSANNRATCDLLVELLAAGEGAMIDDVLPPAAETELAECVPDAAGTLQSYGDADGDETSLAGRYTAPNGDVVTFAMIVNREPGSGGEPFAACNELQARLLDAVAGHPYGPDLADLGPIPVAVVADS